MPSKTPRDTLKVRSRFKVGQEVWIKAKITKITEGPDNQPTLVIVPPKAFAPIRVAESDAVEVPEK